MRPLEELQSSGLLWLINAAALHPRGVALGIVYDLAGTALGWEMVASHDGGPFTYEDSPEIAERFQAVNALIEQARCGDDRVARPLKFGLYPAREEEKS